MKLSDFYPASQAIKQAITEYNAIVEAPSPTTAQIEETLNKFLAASHKSHNIGIAQGAILSIAGGLCANSIFWWMNTQSIYARDLSWIFCVLFIIGLIWVIGDIKNIPSL